MLKTLARNPKVARFVGRAAGAYLRFVRRTTRFATDPAEPYSKIEGKLPIIGACWHGQHFLVPLMRRKGHDFAVLVSRSADGAINAAAVEAMGLKVVRGSGGRDRLKAAKKGGVAGFLGMLDALEHGLSVAQTADVPRGTPRRCGEGVVKLAQHSGRPIVPLGVATKWRIDLGSWDRARIPLPFGRGGFALGDPIFVPAKATPEELEALRLLAEEGLNTVLAKAEELAGIGHA
ncbi:lysophospholipid acyltransferase (LPLAT)-like uncharacterized protein [Rhodopseudomonas julia]|uniref:Lysophospholipid acyltransferase (LPLAT)-like uncharacterized protein n=1 Tax=Rhodopseudomonas julia TaxID=200617 RepID=A0ABU0C2U2_9BRAD|nr:lysophospholipid acyltransferase family protein [Rhodopseudomonas julia]MDQ0324829.1 lysophospholipid acyltransferase (LPLAT)-like uncharacterized protein [Rhodopseudomonas julia]